MPVVRSILLPTHNHPALHQQPVKLGTIEGNQYQVLDGLKVGDRIAVSGLLKLADGAAITPES